MNKHCDSSTATKVSDLRGYGFQDLTGRRFSRWSVVKFAHAKLCGVKRRRYMSYWLCQCSCKEKTLRVVMGHSLIVKTSRSCGCYHIERVTKHGYLSKKKRHHLYMTWTCMNARCASRGSVNFKYYGGRGIGVCARWRDFNNFISDMEPSWKPSLTIERINNNLGYFPSNCRWATRKEQMVNRRCTKFITAFGLTMSASEWATKQSINPATLSYRLKQKWPIEEALTAGEQRNGQIR